MSASILNIGLSALQSYQGAMAITANNIANANTNGFTPAVAQFQETAPGVGVQLSAANSTPLNSTDSNQPSSTDLTSEMVKLMTYKVGFKAAARVVETADTMIGTVLNTRG